MFRLGKQNHSTNHSSSSMAEGCSYTSRRAGEKLWRWQFRYQGKYQQMSPGPYPEVTLENARLKHQAEEEILHSGCNPMEVRKEEKRTRTPSVEASTAIKSFAEIEKKWFDHRKSGKQDRYIRQMETRIYKETYACSARPALWHHCEQAVIRNVRRGTAVVCCFSRNRPGR
jgi:hypothetical protein